MRLIFWSCEVSASAVWIWVCSALTRTDASVGSTCFHADDLIVQNVLLGLELVGRAGDPLLDRADAAAERSEVGDGAADEADGLVHDDLERRLAQVRIPEIGHHRVGLGELAETGLVGADGGIGDLGRGDAALHDLVGGR